MTWPQFYRFRFAPHELHVAWFLEPHPWRARIVRLYGVQIGSWFIGAVKGEVDKPCL